MPKSSKSFLFPDVNVWVALSFEGHIHHQIARRWFESLAEDDGARLCFCRITQLSLLRLLTTEAVMGEETLSQPEAWSVYDHWLEDSRVLLMEEPANLEHTFRSLLRLPLPAAKVWADSYLLAFAEEADLRLVTFDRALKERSSAAVLLR
jgi:toxin-antitoxin system PIN domain toxin